MVFLRTQIKNYMFHVIHANVDLLALLVIYEEHYNHMVLFVLTILVLPLPLQEHVKMAEPTLADGIPLLVLLGVFA